MTIKELHGIVVKGFARMDEFIALVANFIQEQLVHNQIMEKRVGNLETAVKSLDNRVGKLEKVVESLDDQVKNIKIVLKKNNIK
ncbi:hypothetical protein ACA758_00455 [Mycoplasmopsis agassizii]|uniref:hypothetical protein n=1 Tax=Mycoplasmopsis agassizii TaxID=33922 RepID=UPI003527D2C4